MTTGIYSLIFTDCEQVYIGQSINIEKRYKEHLYSLRRGASNKKLQRAYQTHGIPELFILEECNSCDLDAREVFYIETLNTVKDGLNEWEGPVSVCRGIKHPNSKYTEDQIQQVVKLLAANCVANFKEISYLTGVTIATIENISCGRSWAYLAEVMPTEYTAMCTNRGARKARASSASGRGRVYPPILSPEGVEYIVTNITEFSKAHGLNMSHVCGVLNKVRKSHKGWRLKPNTA